MKKVAAEYRRGSSGKNAPEAAPVKEIASVVVAPAPAKEQKKQSAEARQKTSAKRKPLEEKLAKLDKELAAMNREKADIEIWLGREDAYAEENKTQLLAFLKRQGEVTDAVAALEWDWFEVQQKLEEAAA